MSIGYRSFLNIEAGEPLIEAVSRHLAQWTDAKGIGTPSGQLGTFEVKSNDVISIALESDGEARMFRWRREHPRTNAATQMWRTTVNAVEYPDRPGWLWVEIELAEACKRDPYGFQTFMSVPGFLRTLLRELRCYDGRTPASAEPQRATIAGLPDLMDSLADESRRGAVLVASPTARSDGDLYGWAVQASWEMVGVGVMYLLNGETEDAFNEMVGRRHAVASGTVRTYAPAVDLDNAIDPARHRSLSRERIEFSPPKRIAHILGFAQRHRVADVPLPEEAVRVDQFFDSRAEEQESRSGRGVIRLVQPLRDAEPKPEAVPSQRDPSPAWSHLAPAEGDVPRDEPSGQLLTLLSATWPEQTVAVEDLRLENARLRHEREMLTLMVRNHQRFEASVAENLRLLAGAAEGSTGDVDDEPAPGRPHLNGL